MPVMLAYSQLFLWVNILCIDTHGHVYCQIKVPDHLYNEGLLHFPIKPKQISPHSKDSKNCHLINKCNIIL